MSNVAKKQEKGANVSTKAFAAIPKVNKQHVLMLHVSWFGVNSPGICSKDAECEEKKKITPYNKFFLDLENTIKDLIPDEDDAAVINEDAYYWIDAT